MHEFVNLYLLKAENPEAYKKLASTGIMVGFPVTIGGRTHRPDIDIGYHSTVKFFNPDADKPEDIHAIASKLEMAPPDPRHTQIEPGVFKDRLGNDVYVIKLHGPHADKIKEHNSQFAHMGFKNNFQYQPHVSVDKATWQTIVNSGAKNAHEAGIEFGHAELKQGPNTLQHYGPKQGKLTAFETLQNNLQKGAPKLSPQLDINVPHVIFSAENSPYPDKVETKDTHDKVVEHLRRLGENVHEVKGHYGKPERSIIVLHPKDPYAIKRLAHQLGQESMIESDGNNHKMVYLHGPESGRIVTGQGTDFHNQQPQDFYTTLPDGRHFTHKFDFDKSEDLQKGAIKNFAVGLAAAGTIGMMSPNKTTHTPVEHDPKAGSHEVVETTPEAPKYTRQDMLNAISAVESNHGKYTDHEVTASGAKAYGKYGLMPNTIHETIRLNPELRSKHKKATLLNGQDLHNYMKDNPELENQIAEKHVARLEHHFGQNPSHIGYAWLNGITGTYRAKKKNVKFDDHWHVKKINEAYGKNPVYTAQN